MPLNAISSRVAQARVMWGESAQSPGKGVVIIHQPLAPRSLIIVSSPQFAEVLAKLLIADFDGHFDIDVFHSELGKLLEEA